MVLNYENQYINLVATQPRQLGAIATAIINEAKHLNPKHIFEFQLKLGEIEEATISLAKRLRDLTKKILTKLYPQDADNKRIFLGKDLDDALNNLRRRYATIIDMIAQAYYEDPCPSCPRPDPGGGGG
jgi:hypothetical protein